MRNPARRWLPFGSFLFLTASIISCTEIIDTSDYELDRVNASPEMAIPLAFGSLAVSDMLLDSTYIRVDPDGLVYVLYETRQDITDIRDMIKIPDQEFNQTIPILPVVLPPTTSEQEFSSTTTSFDFAVAPEKFTEIKFKEGSKLDFNLRFVGDPNAEDVFAIDFTLPNFTLNGVPLTQRLFANTPAIIDLEGYVAVLNDNNFTAEVAIIELQHDATVEILALTNARINIEFDDLDFQHVRGFFGDRTPSIVEQTIEIGAFGDVLGDAEVAFADPKLDITLVSEYGLPASIEFNPMEMRKSSGESIDVEIVNGNKFSLLAPSVLGDSASSMMSISNIGPIFDFGPTEFFYQIKMRINEGLTEGENFLADTSKLAVKVKMELPIFGKASGLEMKQTFDIDLAEYKDTEFESATFRSRVVNDLPLDAHLQVYFADQDGAIFDSLFVDGETTIIKASTVTDDGELDEPGIADLDIALSSERLSKLFDAEKIVASLKMNTTKEANGEQKHVKFKAGYKVNLSFGLKAKVKLGVDLE